MWILGEHNSDHSRQYPNSGLRQYSLWVWFLSSLLPKLQMKFGILVEEEWGQTSPHDFPMASFLWFLFKVKPKVTSSKRSSLTPVTNVVLHQTSLPSHCQIYSFIERITIWNYFVHLFVYLCTVSFPLNSKFQGNKNLFRAYSCILESRKEPAHCRFKTYLVNEWL